MQYYCSLLLLIFCFLHTDSKMMRNHALMSKLVSNFHKDNPSHIESQTERPEKQQEIVKIVSAMQRVLCHNFPSIPCDVIKQDPTLKKLIEKSIQQLKYKKLSITVEKTTTSPARQLTLFPIINSEDLSNYVQERESGYYYNEERNEKPRHRKHKKYIPKINSELKDSLSKKKTNKHEEKHRTVTGRKKIRKFYPHKLKYKDKMNRGRKEPVYSEENLSLSVDAPESHAQSRLNYQPDTGPPGGWRIDYLKHGNPALNMYEQEPDRLQEKLLKTGPSDNFVIEENLLDQNHLSRKEVLHPDVYIKKNLVRKNAIDINSEGLD